MQNTIDPDSDKCTQEGTDSSKELRTHGLPFGEATLHEESKIANFVRDLMEEYCDTSGRANPDAAGVESGRHGKTIGDVMRKLVGVRVSWY